MPQLADQLRTDGAEEREDSVSERRQSLAKRRQDIMDKVHSYIRYTFHDLGAASEKETKDMETGLRYLNTEEDIVGWEAMCRERLPAMQESARHLYWDKFMDPMLALYSQHPKAINLATIQRWDKRFRDSGVDYKSKEGFIQGAFAEYMQNWKRVAREREDVLASAKKKNIDLAAHPELADLLHENTFLEMDYHERTGLVKRAASFVLAKENGMEKPWKEMRTFLTGLTIGDAPCLHSSKIGTWLLRMQKACTTPDDIETFKETILLPFVANWQEARSRFDVLHKPGALPRGFPTVSVKKFLLWDYDKRISYLEYVEGSKISEGNNSTTLDKQKKEVRYDLNTKDWEGAEKHLNTLLEEYPDDADLLSMQKYLDGHRWEEAAVNDKEKENPQEYLDTIHALLGNANPALATKVYRPALKKGSKTLRRTNQLLYNRVWVRNRGYSNDQDEVMHANSDFNRKKTKEYVDDGHTQQFERNVIHGETATEDAVRDECKSPQALYVDTDNFQPVINKIHDNRDNENFGYWTTAFLTDVSFDAQATDVKNIQRPLLIALRKLEAAGYAYTDSPTLTLKTAA